MNPDSPPADPVGTEDPPPVLGSWRRVHLVVLLALLADIAVLALLGWRFH